MTMTTTVVIHTHEPVTPGHLAQRVSEACAAHGALRPGEKISVVTEDERILEFTITNTPVELPDFLQENS